MIHDVFVEKKSSSINDLSVLVFERRYARRRRTVVYAY